MTIVSIVMRRRPTFRTLAARALTALFAVWCLGCAGFDPLIDSMFGGAGAGMDCGSEVDRSGPDASESAVSGSADSSEGLGCHCLSCHSTSPLSPVAPNSVVRSLELARLAVGDLASVTRAPVAPPPEFATL